MYPNNFKGNMLKKIILFVFLYINMLNAVTNSFIIKHDGLIDKRAQEKINEIGLELQQKLQVNAYVYIVENNGINTDDPRDKRIKQMRKFDNIVLSKIDTKNNYIILLLSIDQSYANILVSNNLKNIIDKDDILDGYVIPLLASKDKNSLFAKTSAAMLNGYAQIADSIANAKDIKLVSSIGSEGKITSAIWKVFMYSLVVFGLGFYIIIIMKQKKKAS